MAVPWRGFLVLLWQVALSIVSWQKKTKLRGVWGYYLWLVWLPGICCANLFCLSVLVLLLGFLCLYYLFIYLFKTNFLLQVTPEWGWLQKPAHSPRGQRLLAPGLQEQNKTCQNLCLDILKLLTLFPCMTRSCSMISLCWERDQMRHQSTACCILCMDS